jgi:hypothetical protein
MPVKPNERFSYTPPAAFTFVSEGGPTLPKSPDIRGSDLWLLSRQRCGSSGSNGASGMLPLRPQSATHGFFLKPLQVDAFCVR